jgi:polyhydroxybutyrate depolymerase
MVHDQIERTYRMYLPSAYRDQSSLALVIALHGSGSTGDDLAASANFEGAAGDAQDCIIVYPDAYEANWNDGRAVAGISAYDLNIDDVGFISDLIDSMIANYGVDPARVYVAGISNGAMMTYRLACEIPGRIAACACVAGSIPQNIYGTCEPDVVMPFVIFNGTDDPYVPWSGGLCGTPEVPLGYVLGGAERM